jgi:hypothetical protein
MSLLKQVVKEMVAAGGTSATSIAAYATPIFAKISKNGKKKGKTSLIQRLTQEGSLYSGGLIRYERVQQSQSTAFARANSFIAEDVTGATDFDQADVISKLEAREKKAKMDRDTTTFGLEQEDGGIVRVYVRADQADEFEEALSQMLAGSDHNKDKENTSVEIAEVLFKLKDKYDIVDVDWGDIQEDEQQEQTIEGGEQQGENPKEPMGDKGALNQAAEEISKDDKSQGDEGEPGDKDEKSDMVVNKPEGGGDEGLRSTLDSIIDMLKVDAKAKAAEAQARKAEADAKQAEWTAKAAASKVKQEEDVLDMETQEKEQRELDKEAKRLAKLAKFRHEKANDYSSKLNGTSEEEELGGNRFPYDPHSDHGHDKAKVSLKQLRDMIYAHIRGDEH